MRPRLRLAGRVAWLVLKTPWLLAGTQLKYLAFRRQFRRAAAAYGLPPRAIKDLCHGLRPTQLLKGTARLGSNRR